MQGSELRESAVASRSKQGRRHFFLRGGSHEQPATDAGQVGSRFFGASVQDDSCPRLTVRSYPGVRCPNSGRPEGEGVLTNSRRS
ncbi:hypothetical protein MTO96_012685 [Rhipicephalus appendiculatus]